MFDVEILSKLDDEMIDFVFENVSSYARKALDTDSEKFTGKLKLKYGLIKYNTTQSKFYNWRYQNYPIVLWEDYFKDIINWDEESSFDFGFKEKYDRLENGLYKQFIINRRLDDAKRFNEDYNTKQILKENIDFYVANLNKENKYWRQF